MFKVDLTVFTTLAQQDASNIIVYDPDVFPGVRFRVTTRAGAATLFASGKFLVVGLSTLVAAWDMLKVLYPWAVASRIQTQPPQ